MRTKRSNLKKLLLTLICLLIIPAFAGCGGSGAADDSSVDVDLTSLSSTMVYSEVYNMVNEPDGYVGKVVKMEGTAASFYDEKAKETYYACIIQDATACCSQGLEYVLDESGEYPEDGEQITVVGRFNTYTAEDGNSYCTLEEASRL